MVLPAPALLIGKPESALAEIVFPSLPIDSRIAFAAVPLNVLPVMEFAELDTSAIWSIAGDTAVEEKVLADTVICETPDAKMPTSAFLNVLPEMLITEELVTEICVCVLLSYGKKLTP